MLGINYLLLTLLGVRFHCTLWSKIKFLEDLRPPERRAYYGMNIVLSEMPSASPARVSHCTQRGQNISLTYFVIACKILNYPNVLFQTTFLSKEHFLGIKIVASMKGKETIKVLSFTVFLKFHYLTIKT